MRRARIAGVAVACFLFAAAVPAEKPLEKAIRYLEEGKPAAAHSTLVEMLERVGPSVRDDKKNLKALAVALLYQAVAEFELGRTWDARWTWRMATYFHPELASVDFGPLGPAGAFLSSQRWAEPPADLDPIAPGPHLPEGIEPPVKVAAPAPRFGDGPLLHRLEDDVHTLLLIEADGRLDSVRILDPRPDPGFAYAILQAMREWRFEPARSAGEPISCWYTMRFQFKIR
jgi:TonB family protein